MLQLDKYINDGEISIGKDDWIGIKENYSQEEIISNLKRQIIGGRIDIPIRRISLNDAEESFCNLLNYKCNPIINGAMTTRYDYEFDNLSGEGAYIDESNIGNIASDYFQQRNRFSCGSINSPSPERTWQNEKFLDGALKALFSLKCEQVNTSTLRTCLSLRKYIASQFKPANAKSIYEKLDSVDVLDFSAGWGDRLCGFYSCDGTRSYIGIDPNKAVYDGYFEQIKLYEKYRHKTVKLINAPAEDVTLGNEIVDTVFTSPPYFNVERYTNDDSQSYKRYKSLDKWLECFLFNVIDKSYKALKSGGNLAINISDVYSGHKINKICDPMNYHIESLGMRYEGCIGMKMAKRPKSAASKSDGVFVEPIWIWRKI